LHICLHKLEDVFYQHAGSSQNDTSYSASQGMVNQAMSMLPIQPGAMVGVPGSTTNLNIGMDYWAAPGSAAVPAMHRKAPAGSARGDQWV
jgi:plant G-box-binding factor